jgi:biopolymer transport protein ExbD
MAIASRDCDDETVTGINVTPLVDITLVLLIIFIVTERQIVSRALPLDLPRSSHGTAEEPHLRIALRTDGGTLVDGVPVSDDDAVRARADAAVAASPDLRVVLDVESQVIHGRVAHVLDVLKQAHVTHVGFGVAPPH